MARPVRVVTDSTSDLRPEEAAALGVVVVPLLVRFGDETFEDRVTLPTDEFYRRLTTSAVLPTTSQPSPSAFLAAYRPLLEEGSDILSLHISAALSGTINAASVARDQLDPQRIVTLDTRQATLGAQVLVRAAAAAARQGRTLAEIVALVEELKPRVRIVATVDTLEYLRRNGRIGRVSALLGALMSVKVLITVADGIVVPLEKVRTRLRALQRVEQLIVDAAPFRGPLLVGHAADLPAAQSLAERLKERLPGQETLLVELGPAIGAHAGPGAVGGAFITERSGG
jgi:DegV family protein with EDD domain